MDKFKFILKYGIPVYTISWNVTTNKLHFIQNINYLHYIFWPICPQGQKQYHEKHRYKGTKLTEKIVFYYFLPKKMLQYLYCLQ